MGMVIDFFFNFVWIDELLEVVTYSCEIGSAKPDPDIYIHTIRRLVVEAGNCLFIDDNEANVVAAQELGGHLCDQF